MNSQQHGERRDRPTVITSLEDADGFRCVDIFERSDGTFGFKEFRRDPEDAGHWTLVGDYSDESYSTKEEALRAAAACLPWFATTIEPHLASETDKARRRPKGPA
jgi:hypothetical protein